MVETFQTSESSVFQIKQKYTIEEDMNNTLMNKFKDMCRPPTISRVGMPPKPHRAHNNLTERKNVQDDRLPVITDVRLKPVIRQSNS